MVIHHTIPRPSPDSAIMEPVWGEVGEASSCIFDLVFWEGGSHGRHFQTLKTFELPRLEDLFWKC